MNDTQYNKGRYSSLSLHSQPPLLINCNQLFERASHKSQWCLRTCMNTFYFAKEDQSWSSLRTNQPVTTQLPKRSHQKGFMVLLWHIHLLRTRTHSFHFTLRPQKNPHVKKRWSHNNTTSLLYPNQTAEQHALGQAQELSFFCFKKHRYLLNRIGTTLVTNAFIVFYNNCFVWIVKLTEF